jgi:hypothetical protein
MKFEWIVPVIVVIVWLINAIVKSRENDEPVRPKRAGAGPREGRNPAGDIDRFLQEIDRLRQKSAEERGTAPPPPVVRPVAVPRARPAPAAPVPRARPAARPAPGRTFESVVGEPIPLTAPAPGPAPAVTAAPPSSTNSTQALIPSMAARLTPTNAIDRPRVTAALKLLRSSNLLATAVVTNVILGPPKCKRR